VHGGIELRISDDGNGFVPADRNDPSHRGLDFAAELARSAGGWWAIRSAPGEGTTVEFWLPDVVMVESAPATE
jgi:signal transduction histidine kinase